MPILRLFPLVNLTLTLALTIALGVAVWGVPVLAAPAAQSTTIEGTITDISFSALPGDPQFIKVNDVIIQLPPGFGTGRMEIGTKVKVTGRQQGSTFMATEVTITGAPAPEPKPIEGPKKDKSNDNGGNNDNGGGNDNGGNNDNGGGNDNGGNDNNVGNDNGGNENR